MPGHRRRRYPTTAASWHPARKAFLVPVKALAKLVRGKLKAMLREPRRPDLVLPEAAWCKPWVVHITPWGEGEHAVLDYLARYVFRVAITNSRIVGLDDDSRDDPIQAAQIRRWRTCRIAGEEFIRRFLQHVLPKGFHKVRYFGLWHPCQARPRSPVSACCCCSTNLPHQQPQPPTMPPTQPVITPAASSDQRNRPPVRSAGSVISS